MFHNQTLWMGGNHILKAGIRRKYFIDWFIKYYDSYVFLSRINSIHFAPLKY